LNALGAPLLLFLSTSAMREKRKGLLKGFFPDPSATPLRECEHFREEKKKRGGTARLLLLRCQILFRDGEEKSSPRSRPRSKERGEREVREKVSTVFFIGSA